MFRQRQHRDAAIKRICGARGMVAQRVSAPWTQSNSSQQMSLVLRGSGELGCYVIYISFNLI